MTPRRRKLRAFYIEEEGITSRRFNGLNGFNPLNPFILRLTSSRGSPLGGGAGEVSSVWVQGTRPTGWFATQLRPFGADADLGRPG